MQPINIIKIHPMINYYMVMLVINTDSGKISR